MLTDSNSFIQFPSKLILNCRNYRLPNMIIPNPHFLLLVILSFVCTLPLQAKDNSEALLELFQRIDALNRDMRTLRGENEQLQHQIEKLKKAQKDGFLNVDDRIDALTKQIQMANKTPIKQPAPNKPTSTKLPPVKKPVLTKPPVKPAEKKPVIAKQPAKPTVKTEKPKAKLIGKAEVVKVKEPTIKIRAATPDEKRAYQKAYALLKQNPSAAIQAFRRYIKQHPNSPLSANSQYWIGEAMYSQKNYQGAVDEFVKVLQTYKKSEKAPDAAIKLGFSFYELKNWVYARRALENVTRYFPNTKASVLAKQRLARMKAAGKY